MEKFMGIIYIIAFILVIFGVALVASHKSKQTKGLTIRVEIEEPQCLEWVTIEGITGCYRW